MRRILETKRLLLRRIVPDDAPIVLEVLNDPDFLRNVGDRGARTEEEARRYIERGPIASYKKYGHGLYLVALKATGAAIGICGVLRRDGLDDPDVGFALLPAFRGEGYASEAADGVMTYARVVLRIQRLCAIVKPDNAASIRVLEKVGFKYERHVRLGEEAPELLLYTTPSGTGRSAVGTRPEGPPSGGPSRAG